MEEHPRYETEEKRRYARGRLRDVAERIINRHGRPSPIPPGIDLGIESRDVNMRFTDGGWASIVSLQNTVVIINIYETEDPLGPLTQYKSWRPGEFVRHDVNPSASVGPSEEAERKGTLAAMSHMLVGSLGAGMDMMINEQEGLDGSPITAQEARELTEQLKDARPFF